MGRGANTVDIKGQKDGLWIYLDDQIPLQELFDAVSDTLSAANNFFSGADVSIHTGLRTLSAAEKEDLRGLVEQTYGLHIKEVLHTESREDEAADEQNDLHPDTPEEIHDDVTPEDEFMKELDETFRGPVASKKFREHTFSPDYLYENEEHAFYFRGTVRSGQTLEYPGNIVILGDVNPGAYIIASGDIIVMGRLHGVVHAGAEGEERAVVIGASFTPSQLRIAQYIGRSPDEKPLARKTQPQTEKAYIKDGVLVIEPIL